MAVRVRTHEGTVAELPVRPGESLARCIWLSGFFPTRALCGGLGRCGACRVRFCSAPPEICAVERAVLGDKAAAEGWRLACRHTATDGMDVALPYTPAEASVSESLSGGADGVGGEALFWGVDLGTTSVCWRAETADGRVAAQGKVLNPQMGAGSDVVSRLAAAATPEGRGRLRGLVLDLLKTIADGLPGPVAGACVAGNTAMTAVLLDADVTGLTRAPYSVPEAGGRDVVLPGLPSVWIPPQPAPFVGGDISAGMAFLTAQEARFPLLLADMGTNGEFALCLSPEQTLLAGVPLGPSLEGMGLEYGGMAGPGNIVGFRLTPAGLEAVVWGNSGTAGREPCRISGTGYLSLLNILLRIGFLTSEGGLDVPPSPLGRRLAATLRRENGVWVLPLPGGAALTARDVEELLKVKAAFSLACERLSAEDGAAGADIVLGGALGRHAPIEVLENLGFLPSGAGRRTRAVGNTSLEGAVLLAREPGRREALIRWSRSCRVLELLSDPHFNAAYLDHMCWGTARRGA